MRGTAVGPVLRSALAPFLLLVTPFVIFVRHNHHGLSHPDVQLCVVVIALIALVLGAGAARWHIFEVVVLAALLVFFADMQLDEAGEKRLTLGFLSAAGVLWILREHAARILSLMMATILALSFVPLGPRRGSAAGVAAGSGAGDLPLLLHVVLDEHIGVEGLPSEFQPDAVRQALESFFAGRSFRLYGRAYSEHSNTAASLGHLLNMESGRYMPGLSRPSSSGLTYTLGRSAYFEHLVRRGYALRIYQSDHLDMCAAATRVISCYTYQPSSLAGLASLDVSNVEKLPVIAGAFLARSEIYERVKRTYASSREYLLEAAGIPLPRWDWERFAPASLGSMPVFDRVAADLRQSRPGQVFVAHLLMPHDPYVFAADCEPRPPRLWVTRADASDAIVPGGVTTRQSRESRYRLYFDQILCTQRRIAELLDAIPAPLRADAIIVVQGDHGSRLGLNPATTEADRLDSSDYADAFSTLFAVRAPGIDAAYDSRPVSIACLLRTLVNEDFRTTRGPLDCPSARHVYFSERPEDRPPLARPLPDFWE